MEFSRKRIPSEDFIWMKILDFWTTPLIFPTQNLDFIWSQQTEKQKFYIEWNVMSEQIKMPVRHFLCRDYLHIGFYIKVLLFCSLAPDRINIFVRKRGDCLRNLRLLDLNLEWKSPEGIHFLLNVNPLEFNSMESHNFLENLHSRQLWI